MFSFARKSFSFIFLILLLPLSSYPWLWNGYMDGFLALYFSIATLLYGRYLEHLQPIDIISSFACMVFLLYLKNEGILGLLSGIFSITLVFLLLRKELRLSRKHFVNHWRYYLLGILAILPFVLWIVIKRQLNITNDLEVGSFQSIINIPNRIRDGSILLIIQSIYVQLKTPLLLFGLLAFISLMKKISIPKDSLTALVTAGVYCLGMGAIYLLTPKDLTWHLNTSISRTMLPIIGCLYVGSYFILKQVENKTRKLLSST
jgi:hypothetical protein